MSRDQDDDAQLIDLLRALPAPAPSEEFLVGARRRYLAALEARDRRLVFTGLAAALVGLAALVTLLALIVEPPALLAWLGGAMADLARWATGLGVLVGLVPASIWASAVLGSTAAVLSLILLTRAGSLVHVK